jgi:hypothetical protein
MGQVGVATVEIASPPPRPSAGTWGSSSMPEPDVANVSYESTGI